MQANLKLKTKLQFYNQVKVIDDVMKSFHGNSDHFIRATLIGLLKIGLSFLACHLGVTSNFPFFRSS